IATVWAQQSEVSKSSDQTYLAAETKAKADCLALWADHALDPFRGKLALDGEQTTYAMLADPERLRPQDKPLADLVSKTYKRCRALYAPALAMLPPAVKTVVQGIFPKQDALIGQLSSGKITFGDYNLAMARLAGDLARAATPQPAQVSAASAPETKKSEQASEQ